MEYELFNSLKYNRALNSIVNEIFRRFRAEIGLNGYWIVFGYERRFELMDYLYKDYLYKDSIYNHGYFCHMFMIIIGFYSPQEFEERISHIPISGDIVFREGVCHFRNAYECYVIAKHIHRKIDDCVPIWKYIERSDNQVFNKILDQVWDGIRDDVHRWTNTKSSRNLA